MKQHRPQKTFLINKELAKNKSGKFVPSILICFVLCFCAIAHGQENNQANNKNSKQDGKQDSSQETQAATTNTPNVDKKKPRTNFEWDPMPGAKSYEIEIKSKRTDTKPSFFNITTTFWNGDLKPGKYTMRLRSKDHRGVPGEWSEAEEFVVKMQVANLLYPADNEAVKTKDNEQAEIKLLWDEVPYAATYEVNLKDESGKLISTDPVSTNNLAIKIPVASQYTWSVVAIDEFGEKGPAGSGPFHFTLLGKELNLPKIKGPKSPFVRELTWDKSDFAEKYEVTLKYKDKTTKKWKTITSDELTVTKLNFLNSYKGGQYQLRVTALADLRQKSKSHLINFSVALGDRSPLAESIALNRKSIDRTKSWYFIASYLITQIQYAAINIDHGSGPSTNAFGGTGRLGLGWLDEDSPMGFLGICDLSGFIINQKNYTYPSLEAHGLIRYAIGDLGEFRASAGLYYKDIPEILANSRTGEFTVKQLGVTGMHAGGEYWYSMNSKLGLQTNGRMYYPLSGKTPNGQNIIPVMSYQFGFLGSYRLNEKATGLMGYAYRKDIIYYKSANADIISNYTANQISIAGNYLNFFLEWDL